MIDTIKKYLSSKDIEMIQLGATLLQNNYPEPQWYNILQECIQKEISSKRGLLTVREWPTHSFLIENGKILIKEGWPFHSLWQQLDKSRKHTYNIHTGRVGMELIEEAIKNKYNEDNNQR